MKLAILAILAALALAAWKLHRDAAAFRAPLPDGSELMARYLVDCGAESTWRDCYLDGLAGPDHG